jgi:hypothetical protein
MAIRQLYHGADGDEILSIIRSREMRPNRDNEIFFGDFEYDRTQLYFQGTDTRRKASFVIKVEINIPDDVRHYRKPTPGVPNTFVLQTSNPLPVEVLEMYVRKGRVGGFVEERPIRGTAAIVNYLNQQ